MKYAILVIFLLWLLIQCFGIYGYGLHGFFDSLDHKHYVGHPIDYIMHWVLFFGPPAAAVLLGIFEFFRKK